MSHNHLEYDIIYSVVSCSHNFDDNIMKLIKSFMLNCVKTNTEQFCVKYGKKDGLYLSYYPNGITQYETFYVNGKEHGTAFMWNDKGKMIASNRMLHGKKHGVCMTYDKYDRIETIKMFKKGREHGLSFDYRTNKSTIMYNGYQHYYWYDMYKENNRRLIIWIKRHAHFFDDIFVRMILRELEK